MSYSKPNSINANDIKALVDKRIHQAVLTLLENYDFRLLLGSLILRSGIERSDFSGSSDNLPYFEGRRSMGLELMRICDSISKDGDALYGLRKRTDSVIEYKELEQYYFDFLKEK